MTRRLRRVLSGIMTSEDLAHVYNSYDVVGDIAVIRLTKESYGHGEVIAQALMSGHKNVKTVLAQKGAVKGDFRVRALEHIIGEKRTITVHKESGCMFRVDVERCYFSPRLHHERLRIAGLAKDGEVVVNMFSGVGCFSIQVAKKSNAERVYSIDVNPIAVGYMQENVRINDLYGKVIPMLGDAKRVIENRLCNVADRVIMPLPEKALKYLPYALLALKKGGGWIHYYDFEHAVKDERVVEKVKRKVAMELESLGTAFKMPFGRIIRSTGPNWYQVVLDINIERRKTERCV